MSLNLSSLTESNIFLNILFNNLTSAIFLIDKNGKIHSVNYSFQSFFGKTEEEVNGQLCGNAIGCSFTVDENKLCGTTTKCLECELRKNVFESFTQKSNILQKILIKEFYIANKKNTKYLQYSIRYIFFNNTEFVILIFDDITETEQQKNVIKTKSQEIIDSIEYAKKIQKKILPQNDILSSIFSESFILFKPKDIVSGDFYWVYTNRNHIYLAVADCTGHGVPGAFLSLLGFTFLNEIIGEMGMISPSLILDRLRDLIIETLNQKTKLNELKDGMDISLVALNLDTLECEYAGANNSLYLIRNSNDIAQFEEIKADKMPVAINETMASFTNHKIQLSKSDILYLRTDGYADQFGGIKNKKFLSKHLKELLLSFNSKPLIDQKEILDKTFKEWKGDNNQVDDVTIIGIKI